MRRKTFEAYCESCGIDSYIKGKLEKKVEFVYSGMESGVKKFVCPKNHNYEWDDVMKYQVKRKKR